MGMTVGADIPEADPAVIRTCGMRAEMAGGIDLAATTSGQEHTRWRRTGRLWLQPDLLLIQRAIGLASETCKRFGFALEPERLRRGWRGLAAPPKRTEQENEKHEEHTSEQREIKVESHDQLLHASVNGLSISHVESR
jgi:hypothetical protein